MAGNHFFQEMQDIHARKHAAAMDSPMELFDEIDMPFNLMGETCKDPDEALQRELDRREGRIISERRQTTLLHNERNT